METDFIVRVRVGRGICGDCLFFSLPDCRDDICPGGADVWEVITVKKHATQQADSSDLANAPRKVDIKQAMLANIRKHHNGE